MKKDYDVTYLSDKGVQTSVIVQAENEDEAGWEAVNHSTAFGNKPLKKITSIKEFKILPYQK